MSYRWEFLSFGLEPIQTQGESVEVAVLVPVDQNVEIKLTGLDSYGKSSTTSIVLPVRKNHPPVARIQASKTEPLPGESLTLTSTSLDMDNDIVSTHWSTSDGRNFMGESIELSFANAGEFTVSLTITDRAGQQDSASVSIDTTGKPMAKLLTRNTKGAFPLPVLFDTTQSSDPNGTLEFVELDYGDGSPVVNELTKETHLYESAGTFTAKLTLRDNEGLERISEVQIEVIDGIAVSSIPPAFAVVGNQYQYQPTIIDGGEYTLELVSAPEGMQVIDDNRLEWTPNMLQVGMNNVVVNIVREGELPGVQEFEIQVSEPVVAAVSMVDPVVGGTITVANPSSVFDGTTVTVPAGAFNGEREVKINVTEFPQGMASEELPLALTIDVEGEDLLNLPIKIQFGASLNNLSDQNSVVAIEGPLEPNYGDIEIGGVRSLIFSSFINSFIDGKFSDLLLCEVAKTFHVKKFPTDTITKQQKAIVVNLTKRNMDNVISFLNDTMEELIVLTQKKTGTTLDGIIQVQISDLPNKSFARTSYGSQKILIDANFFSENLARGKNVLKGILIHEIFHLVQFQKIKGPKLIDKGDVRKNFCRNAFFVRSVENSLLLEISADNFSFSNTEKATIKGNINALSGMLYVNLIDGAKRSLSRQELLSNGDLDVDFGMLASNYTKTSLSLETQGENRLTGEHYNYFTFVEYLKNNFNKGEIELLNFLQEQSDNLVNNFLNPNFQDLELLQAFIAPLRLTDVYVDYITEINKDSTSSSFISYSKKDMHNSTSGRIKDDNEFRRQNNLEYLFIPTIFGAETTSDMLNLISVNSLRKRGNSIHDIDKKIVNILPRLTVLSPLTAFSSSAEFFPGNTFMNSTNFEYLNPSDKRKYFTLVNASESLKVVIEKCYVDIKRSSLPYRSDSISELRQPNPVDLFELTICDGSKMVFDYNNPGTTMKFSLPDIDTFPSRLPVNSGGRYRLARVFVHAVNTNYDPTGKENKTVILNEFKVGWDAEDHQGRACFVNWRNMQNDMVVPGGEVFDGFIEFDLIGHNPDFQNLNKIIEVPFLENPQAGSSSFNCMDYVGNIESETIIKNGFFGLRKIDNIFPYVLEGPLIDPPSKGKFEKNLGVGVQSFDIEAREEVGTNCPSPRPRLKQFPEFEDISCRMRANKVFGETVIEQ